MFEKKEVPKIDYDSVIGQDILGLLDRLETLEYENKRLERFFEINTLEWDAHYSESRRIISQTKEILLELKSRVNFLKQNFLAIIYQLKMKSGKEDLEKITRKVDDWKLEKFITTAEFERMLK
jgi:hypothetical protein